MRLRELSISKINEMGVSDSTLQALTRPCETCIHDTNRYCLDNMEFDSNCSECCQIHLRTHAHNDDDSGSEGVAEENAAPENAGP